MRTATTHSHARAINFIMVCGALGGVCYVGYAMIMDLLILPPSGAPGGPGLTYGAQAMMIIYPLAILLGSSIGASFAITRWWVTVIALAAPGLIAHYCSGLWREQQARYGADPSDLIVFVPLLTASVVCILLNPLLALAGYVWHLRSNSHPSAM